METVYRRAQFNELLARINEPRSKMQVIVGPRQVGKSTLISQVLEEYALPFDSYSADDVIGTILVITGKPYLASTTNTTPNERSIQNSRPLSGNNNDIILFTI